MTRITPLIVLAFAFAAHASPDPAKYECRWTDDAITIDGKPDEPAWAKAEPIDKFRKAWEGDKETPVKSPTSARFLWDQDYLYFVAEMRDPDLYAKVTEHDGMVWTDDAFEMFFKPAADKPGYYELNFNPLNTVMDAYFPSRNAGGWTKHRKNGAFDIESAVRLKGTLNNPADRDEGWTVEGRIPWKAFHRTGGRPKPGEAWRFAPCRVDISAGDPPTQELSSAAVLNSKRTANFHTHEDYPTLVFTASSTNAATTQPHAHPPARKAEGRPGQTPPLATNVAGAQAIEMLRQSIAQMRDANRGE